MKTQPKFQKGDILKCFDEPECYQILDIFYNGEVGDTYDTSYYDDIFEEDCECQAKVETRGEEYTYALLELNTTIELFVFEKYLIKVQEDKR